MEVMAGFVIVRDGKEHPMSFDESHIERTVIVNKVEIPLQSLDDWKKYYTLMNREEKAALCKY